MNPLYDPSYVLSPLIATCINIILLISVWKLSRRDLSSKLFSIILVSFGLSSFFTFLMRNSPDTHYAMVWDRALIAAALPGYAIYYHFTIVYSKITSNKWVIPGIYMVIAVLATIVAATDLGIKEMTLEHYGYAPVIGSVGFLSYIPLPVLVIVGGYNLVRGYLSSRSDEERNRLLYLIMASAFPLLGAGLDAFSDLPPAFIWSNMIFCIICSVAIVKYHLLDIRIIIRKSLVYILISVVIAVPYVATIYLLYYFFKPVLEAWWTHVIVVLLLAIILRPLYSWAQQFVDRLFYRDRYDYFKELERFGNETQSITNLKELSSTVVKLFGGAMRASTVTLLLPSESKEFFTTSSCIGWENSYSRIKLSKISPLVKWLTLNGNILSAEQIDVIPQLQSFALKERSTLKLMRANLYVPIITRQGELCSILILGEKLSQKPYSAADKQLLSTLSKQLAMTIDNARLYEEMRESEEKLRLIYRSMSEGIIVLDLEGKIISMNEAAYSMYGYDNEKTLVGMSLFQLAANEDKANIVENLRDAINDKHMKAYEYIVLRKDGSEFFAELSTAVLEDQSGDPTGFVVVVEDITKRKQAEERERRLQAELNLSSRLASVGELAAGVAHEINNPLTGIIGFSQRLLRKSNDETSKRDLERIFGEAQRAARVVENLRTFARRSEPKKEMININDVLNKSIEMRAYELKTSNIEIVTDPAIEIPPVMADFHQIQQVFLNIIMNAEQVMKETKKGTKLIIKTQKIGKLFQISFTDDGPGISEENTDKIFHPFFTTRGDRGGTGLGLSICHGIIADHGGNIYFKSTLGKGTTFFVELPVSRESDQVKLIK